MHHTLETIEFRDPVRSQRDLAELLQHTPVGIRPQLEALLNSSPDPDSAVHYGLMLAQQHPQVLRSCSSSELEKWFAVFSFSRFLSDEVLQHPDWVSYAGVIEHVWSAEEYEAHLSERLRDSTGALSLLLASFRRKQLLRILFRDIFALGTLAEITEEISNLAEAILEVGYREIRKELVGRFGMPRCEDGAESGMAVIALGKLGGGELNYSSDIDLMFLYDANGHTDGPNGISNKEFYKKLANQYTTLLSTYTAEGLCYRVDLRLRPEGSLGEVVISSEGAARYYAGRARDWELQMMIKARVAAGDRALGKRFLDTVEPLTYSTTLDFSAVEAVSATRERISEKLSRRRGPKAAAFDVKLAPGGIRDIEFLVQCLQRLHGGRVPWVRHGGTLHALARLHDKNLLSGTEYGKLASAYIFLRHLEHRLQFEDDRQTHTLPSKREDLDRLARKMPVRELPENASGEHLLSRLNQHLESVQESYERVIHAQQPLYYTAPAREDVSAVSQPLEPISTTALRTLNERAPQLAAELQRSPLQRGSVAFQHFAEKALAKPELLAVLNGGGPAVRYLLDIVEHSPHFADELIRTPDLLHELNPSRLVDKGSPYTEQTAQLASAQELRRFYRQEMFRIQAASLCLRVPVFETLSQTSELADAAILVAYRLALQQVQASHPAEVAEATRHQLMVIALGRLGLREFDIASDADLVFVLPDENAASVVFWTRVAERIIDLITAYTAEGLMFTVDTRLRPNGGSGALVQSESAFKEYFGRGAQTWEGIAYMKTRAVAGDMERATAFLDQLQTIDWRRYGQSGRSKKDLRQMRMRLEKEQGPGNPLKAGQGGFYDIDFALLYLRLKSAGIFFKVLNTPERIDIIEKMGHLDRADAEFLHDAATFYRAIDHGLRLASGHPEGSLPNAEQQLENLTELVHRWVPEHLTHFPLPTQLLQIRNRTRDLFDRLFA